MRDLPLGAVHVDPKGRFFLSHVSEGLLAFSPKCTHLGCAVPWKADEPSYDDPGLGYPPTGRFNCPCNGSLYDRYGQIIQGPAPRPLDTYPVRVEGERVYVDLNPYSLAIRESGDRGQPVWVGPTATDLKAG
ncbi:MAG: ubiquinol-cytochrome c reductase iron-sulfur subunit [Chloroflexota bacterium]